VRAGAGTRTDQIRDAERALALEAENAYRRTITDWKATRPADVGASVTPGRIYKALEGHSRAADSREGQSRAADSIAPRSALRFRQSPAPTTRIPQQRAANQALTFIRHPAPTPGTRKRPLCSDFSATRGMISTRTAVDSRRFAGIQALSRHIIWRRIGTHDVLVEP
jgi:hypothetical protein